MSHSTNEENLQTKSFSASKEKICKWKNLHLQSFHLQKIQPNWALLSPGDPNRWLIAQCALRGYGIIQHGRRELGGKKGLQLGEGGLRGFSSLCFQLWRIKIWMFKESMMMMWALTAREFVSLLGVIILKDFRDTKRNRCRCLWSNFNFSSELNLKYMIQYLRVRDKYDQSVTRCISMSPNCI